MRPLLALQGSGTTAGVSHQPDRQGITNPAGQLTQIAYDASRRVTSLTRVNPQGANSVTGYDYTVAGHTRLTDADGHPPVDYTVDVAGRVTAVTDAKGKATSTSYTPSAKVGSSTNASGGTTANVYGANSESLTESTGPSGAKTSATYAAPGQPYLPDSVTNPMGNASTFTYSGPGTWPPPATPWPRSPPSTTTLTGPWMWPGRPVWLTPTTPMTPPTS